MRNVCKSNFNSIKCVGFNTGVNNSPARLLGVLKFFGLKNNSCTTAGAEVDSENTACNSMGC